MKRYGKREGRVEDRNRERLRLEWSHDSTTDITTFFEAALQIRKKEAKSITLQEYGQLSRKRIPSGNWKRCSSVEVSAKENHSPTRILKKKKRTMSLTGERYVELLFKSNERRTCFPVDK